MDCICTDLDLYLAMLRITAWHLLIILPALLVLWWIATPSPVAVVKGMKANVERYWRERYSQED